MTDIQKMTERLLEEVQKLHHRQELSKTVTEDYFEPGMMEYLHGAISFQELREHVKIEEQKWIRKAKRYSLYDDPPYRIK